jgi:acyl-CoA thioester hydrolase
MNLSNGQLDAIYHHQCSLQLRVRYAETDAQGVVHHANYPVWFEMGRVEYLRGLGLSYREIEQRGIFLVVTELQLKLRRPAVFDDELQLVTRISLLKSRLVAFDYSLYNSVTANTPMVTGRSEHMATDTRRRAVMLPGELVAALAGAGAV